MSSNVTLNARVINSLKSSHAAVNKARQSYVTGYGNMREAFRAFVKASAEHVVKLQNVEEQLLKTAKTPEQVKAVKQWRFDNTRAFRIAQVDELFAALPDTKRESHERTLNRAITAYVKEAGITYKAPVSQTEAAQKKAASRGTKSRQVNNSSKHSGVKEVKANNVFPTLQAEVTAIMDRTTGFIPSGKIEQYRATYAAFLVQLEPFFKATADGTPFDEKAPAVTKAPAKRAPRAKAKPTA